MGVPVEMQKADKPYANPVGTDGIPFIEFSAVDVTPIASLLELPRMLREITADPAADPVDPEPT